MNADHILVVMNGEIIEEGSHDDLVHKKGKYNALWSKQILVTPHKSRSRSRSPNKGDAQIVNDLTPNRHRVELAKALKTTAHEEPSGGDQNVGSGAKTDATSDKDKKPELGLSAEEKKPGQGTKSDSGHHREVSEACTESNTSTNSA